MATLPVTPSVVQEIVDTQAERELWTIVKEHERPPFFFPDEGVGNRLNRAARVVTEGRITPNSDGSYTVEGSEGRTYRCAESCSCPQSQKGKSKWCYHMCAVALYIEWCRRLGHSAQPALPLPPVTVDERLSAPPVEEIPMVDDPYIPAPDVSTTGTLEASQAVLEPPAATRALTPVAPQVDDLEAALQTWTTQRAVVRRFLKQELQPNIDYYTLRIGGKDSKPSLSKAGAEKVMGWLKIQASFTPDTGTWEMLGRPQDLVAYVCTLRTRSGEIVGEGRGARSLKKDGGDVNKAIKMAEKSACVSAVLRTGCLSDVFTQDVEDQREQEEPVKPARPSSSDLRSRIWVLVQAADATITTREACATYVQQVTGLPLHPDHYGAIVAHLEAEAR